MSHTCTRGLVLRVRPLTETSLIVHWLTPDFGRLATVAKGARRPKSPFRGKLDLFYLAEFSFIPSRRSELHTLAEVNVRDLHLALRQDLDRIQQASQAVRLIERTTETETPLPEIFTLMHSWLGHLSRPTIPPSALLAFETKLLCELGLLPDGKGGQLSCGAAQVLKHLVMDDWPVLARLQLSAAQMAELDQFLRGCLAASGFTPLPRGSMMAR